MASTRKSRGTYNAGGGKELASHSRRLGIFKLTFGSADLDRQRVQQGRRTNGARAGSYYWKLAHLLE